MIGAPSASPPPAVSPQKRHHYLRNNGDKQEPAFAGPLIQGLVQGLTRIHLLQLRGWMRGSYCFLRLTDEHRSKVDTSKSQFLPSFPGIFASLCQPPLLLGTTPFQNRIEHQFSPSPCPHQPLGLRSQGGRGPPTPPCMHACQVFSAVSDPLRPHGLQPARLLCPWDSPGNRTGGGCHALLQGIFPTRGSTPHLYLLYWRADTTSATLTRLDSGGLPPRATLTCPGP